MNYLSPPDVAAEYGIPVRTVQAACNSGAIKATKFGRVWAIEPEDAQEYALRWRPHNGNGEVDE